MYLFAIFYILIFLKGGGGGNFNSPQSFSPFFLSFFSFFFFRVLVVLSYYISHICYLVCRLNSGEAASEVRRRNTYTVTISGFVNYTKTNQHVIQLPGNEGHSF